MSKEAKPLQILFTKEEKEILENVRRKLGLRSWGETVRFLIKKEENEI